MKIKKEESSSHKYVFEFDFKLSIVDFCRATKERVGYKNFSWVNRGWRFSNLDIVETICNRFPEVEVHANMQEDIEKWILHKKQEEIKLKKAEDLKCATTSDLIINNIKGELRPYQKIGVEFFINNNGKAILGDEMGIGKSVQSLAYVTHQNFSKILIICPSIVKDGWKNEIKKWTNLKELIINSKTKLSIDDFNKYDIFVLNYDILKKFYVFLSSIRFDCAIIDECTYIKSQEAKRTKITKEIIKNIPSVLLLSGTPILSRPLEFFNALEIMDPLVWNDSFSYAVRYCNGHKNKYGKWDFSGSSNLNELREKIGRYFLRRTKKDVLPELPPKQRIDFPVELSLEKRSEYDLAIESFKEYLAEVKKKTNKEIEKTIRAETLAKLNELRQITTMGKIKVAEELINNITNSGNKVIVFSCYNEPLNELQKLFGDKAVTITGKTPENDRIKKISDFKEKDNVNILFGGIKCLGIGITLTEASNVVFLDYAWVPAEMRQAEDRVHRISQEAESVNIYQLYSQNTIDEKMKDILINKQHIFDQLFEKDSNSGQSSIMKDLINNIQK